MGLSPYYRGADCNFWALQDDNPHYVGATIHLLSKGLTRKVLYHALAKLREKPFNYTMKTVKSAVDLVGSKLKTNQYSNIKVSESIKIKK